MIDMFASPHGTGWTEDKYLHDYLDRARGAGITGSDMTIAAGSYSFDQFLNELYQYRRVMAQTPDKYTFVRSVRDIEHAHITGKTAVIWNSQTATIIDGDLKKIPLLKEMGLASIILSYNDGGYMVKAFKAGADGCGELSKILAAVTDELWKRGYSDEDLEKIYGRNKMRVYREVWEGVAPEIDPVAPEKRYDYISDLRKKWQTR